MNGLRASELSVHKSEAYPATKVKCNTVVLEQNTKDYNSFTSPFSFQAEFHRNSCRECWRKCHFISDLDL